MSYNLLLDTSFEKRDNWKFRNCKYENGYLISTDRVFGIEQEIVLPNPTKLYFRWNYKVETQGILNVSIGIQNGKVLDINKRVPKLNKKQSISVIDNAKKERVKLHLIFESTEKTNRVYVDSPLLADLNYLGKSTWLKWILDRTIFFMNGYSYSNLYKESEITKDNLDFKEFGLEEGKVGSIVDTQVPLETILDAKLIPNNYYLLKLDYTQINKFGNVEFEYGMSKSNKIDDDQLFMVFKATDKDKLKLVVKPNDVISYKINLKHILLIDITKMKLQKQDIPYIVFV